MARRWPWFPGAYLHAVNGPHPGVGDLGQPSARPVTNSTGSSIGRVIGRDREPGRADGSDRGDGAVGEPGRVLEVGVGVQESGAPPSIGGARPTGSSRVGPVRMCWSARSARMRSARASQSGGWPPDGDSVRAVDVDQHRRGHGVERLVSVVVVGLFR